MDPVATDECTFRPQRSSFTIGHLVLVVAMVVILGSVLLPVVGDSRHPKMAMSFSNLKQLTLSTLMYANDFDDQFVIVGQWNSNDPDAHQEYHRSPYMPWTGLIEVYERNVEITMSPMIGGTRPFKGPGKNSCDTMRSCALLYPTYGYNGVYLSPSFLRKDGSARITSISTRAVANPEQQVVLTEIWSPTRTHYGATSSGANDAYISFATAEAPDGATDIAVGKPYGRFSWGGYSKRIDAMLGKPSEGQRTAGVAFRYAERTPVAFADGHVKAMFADQLAVGTDWNRGSIRKARNLKNETYMWDPRGL